ncbi:hypothetical protein DID77_00210 [Candidatus Marinamargulisbacteria bacterium SCGC AG-439-L15]|nr:hypothetical protein DID77_00210 [Candidatus Marinamargulisbacteria bacterium SCGC AG-439-L15]
MASGIGANAAGRRDAMDNRMQRPGKKTGTTRPDSPGNLPATPGGNPSPEAVTAENMNMRTQLGLGGAGGAGGTGGTGGTDGTDKVVTRPRAGDLRTGDGTKEAKEKRLELDRIDMRDTLKKKLDACTDPSFLIMIETTLGKIDNFSYKDLSDMKLFKMNDLLDTAKTNPLSSVKTQFLSLLEVLKGIKEEREANLTKDISDSQSSQLLSTIKETANQQLGAVLLEGLKETVSEASGHDIISSIENLVNLVKARTALNDAKKFNAIVTAESQGIAKALTDTMQAKYRSLGLEPPAAATLDLTELQKTLNDEKITTAGDVLTIVSAACSGVPVAGAIIGAFAALTESSSAVSSHKEMKQLTQKQTQLSAHTKQLETNFFNTIHPKHLQVNPKPSSVRSSDLIPIEQAIRNVIQKPLTDFTPQDYTTLDTQLTNLSTNLDEQPVETLQTHYLELLAHKCLDHSLQEGKLAAKGARNEAIKNGAKAVGTVAAISALTLSGFGVPVIAAVGAGAFALKGLSQSSQSSEGDSAADQSKAGLEKHQAQQSGFSTILEHSIEAVQNGCGMEVAQQLFQIVINRQRSKDNISGSQTPLFKTLKGVIGLDEAVKLLTS